MPATVRRLLGDATLGLRLLTPEPALPDGSLSMPVSWVHSSDLADPTPFLSAGQVLLTTGSQLPADDSTDATDAAVGRYVSRLAAHGIAALGFGTGVVRAVPPRSLVTACGANGLPLFEVPYRTPFIAVARLAADIAAKDAYARSTWTLRAQRAIAVAATRPDGLSATLTELSRQLEKWVAMFDAAGRLDRVFPTRTDGATLSAVRPEVERMLRSGRRASRSVQVGQETVTLQTLGARGRLRGILALGGPVGDVRDGAGGPAGLDEASRQVVTTVIALAGLALEQNHALDRARGQLRRGLLRLLFNGDVELAETTSNEVWGPLPGEPVIAAVSDVPAERAETIAERLERRAADASGRLFFAMHGNRVLICVAADARGALDEIADELELHLGASEPHDWANLVRASAQAEQAAAFRLAPQAQQAQHRADAAVDGDGTGATGSVTDFSAIASRGVLALLNGPAAREVGLSVLTPLIVHDRAVHDQVNAAQLVDTLHAWLAHNGEYEATARELGVHRHTVRARIATAERLLGRDLSSFATRAELWAALMAASEPA